MSSIQNNRQYYETGFNGADRRQDWQSERACVTGGGDDRAAVAPQTTSPAGKLPDSAPSQHAPLRRSLFRL